MPAMIPQKRVLRINLHLNGSWTVNFKFKFRVNLKFVQVLSWILKFPSPILVQRSGTKNANFRTFSTRNYLFIHRNNDPSLQEAHYQTWTCWAFLCSQAVATCWQAAAVLLQQWTADIGCSTHCSKAARMWRPFQEYSGHHWRQDHLSGLLLHNAGTL